MTTPVPPSSFTGSLKTAVQVLVSCGIAVGLARLVLLVGHLSAFELADIYIPLTGIYYAGISALEVKYPKYGWLLYLLPSELPT
jgi:hypothetical protein